MVQSSFFSKQYTRKDKLSRKVMVVLASKTNDNVTRKKTQNSTRVQARATTAAIRQSSVLVDFELDMPINTSVTRAAPKMKMKATFSASQRML